jgi:hypothetical protein
VRGRAKAPSSDIKPADPTERLRRALRDADRLLKPSLRVRPHLFKESSTPGSAICKTPYAGPTQVLPKCPSKGGYKESEYDGARYDVCDTITTLVGHYFVQSTLLTGDRNSARENRQPADPNSGSRAVYPNHYYYF